MVLSQMVRSSLLMIRGADSHGEVYRFDDSSEEWELDSRQVKSLSAEDTRSERGHIDNDKSVVQRLPFGEDGSAVSQDGTYYVMEKDGDTDILRKSTTPRDSDSWTEIDRWTGVGRSGSATSISLKAAHCWPQSGTKYTVRLTAGTRSRRYILSQIQIMRFGRLPKPVTVTFSERSTRITRDSSNRPTMARRGQSLAMRRRLVSLTATCTKSAPTQSTTG